MIKPEISDGRDALKIYSIAAHRGFADALVAGLIPRYGNSELGLARLTLLLPSQRAARTITEAFVRVSGGGMLLPRLVVVGDLDLDEALGTLFDPIDDSADDVPPAAATTRRWLRLAEHLRAVHGDAAPRGTALLRQARAIAQTMDRLAVEGVDPGQLLAEDVISIVGDQSAHWQRSTTAFLKVWTHWRAELAHRHEVDAPTRRNLLLDRTARAWKQTPPAHPVVAVGITSASPAIAQLLRVIAGLPQGAVILPDLDLAMDDAVWDMLGRAGKADQPGEPPFGRDDAVTHPQYHLKLLLHRMGIARYEVRPWHRAGLSAAPPARSRAISSLFLPPLACARWVDLPEPQRRLTGVRLLTSEHPGAEASAIAVLIREALEQPDPLTEAGRRVALVTPDRGLAARVVAQLQRWQITADDSAGRPLPQTAAGRVLLLLAEVMGEGAAPIPLIALLSHPLVQAGEARPAWLENVRELDLLLRGPRPAPGLAPLRALVGRMSEDQKPKRPQLAAWWAGVEPILAPLMLADGDAPLADLLDRLITAAQALGGDGVWGRADGRALAGFVDDLRDTAGEVGTLLRPPELSALLRAEMDRVAVRPSWGGHPRLAIYGLLEARMSRADLVICAGLVEGSWPGAPTPDPLLPPAVLRHLGVPGADFHIGLAAHDLAGALGAPDVVLSWARRDEAGPVIPSRFVLRVAAMLGSELADRHREVGAQVLAQALGDATLAPAYMRPQPRPSAEQRQVDISATGLDRLRSDPYQFYASAILRLSALDGLDAEPSAAMKGSAVHDILDTWHKSGGGPAELRAIAAEVLDGMSAHPLMRALWRPRLLAALDWIGVEVGEMRKKAREVIATECWGEMQFDGVRVHGRADRIDRLDDGRLAIIDYKTGLPPSARMVENGYSLQLGTLGLIAASGGFPGITGDPQRFEYWSLGKKKDRFGYWVEPILEGTKKSGVPRDEFLDRTADFLREAIDAWIKGDTPFTARLNLDIGGYNDYDQLMRLEEWLWRLDRKGEAA